MFSEAVSGVVVGEGQQAFNALSSASREPPPRARRTISTSSVRLMRAVTQASPICILALLAACACSSRSTASVSTCSTETYTSVPTDSSSPVPTPNPRGNCPATRAMTLSVHGIPGPKSGQGHMPPLWGAIKSEGFAFILWAEEGHRYDELETPEHRLAKAPGKVRLRPTIGQTRPRRISTERTHAAVSVLRPLGAQPSDVARVINDPDIQEALGMGDSVSQPTLNRMPERTTRRGTTTRVRLKRWSGGCRKDGQTLPERDRVAICGRRTTLSDPER